MMMIGGLSEDLSEQADYEDTMDIPDSVRLAASKMTSRQHSRADQTNTTGGAQNPAGPPSSPEDPSSPTTSITPTEFTSTTNPTGGAPQTTAAAWTKEIRNSKVDPNMISTFSGLTLNKQTVRHEKLAKARVLYLGSNIVRDDKVKDVTGLQNYLRMCYRPDSEQNGIDTWVTAFSSGIQMQHVEDTLSITWFPIKLLHLAAAVRYAPMTPDEEKAAGHGRRHRRPRYHFRPVDHPAENSGPGGLPASFPDPPLFTCLLERQRGEGEKVKDCHVFMCKSIDQAVALVQSCTTAFQNKSGWTDEVPPISMIPKPKPTPPPNANPIWQNNFQPHVSTMPRGIGPARFPMNTMPRMMMGAPPSFMIGQPAPRFIVPPPPQPESIASRSSYYTGSYSDSEESYESEYLRERNREFYSKQRWDRNRSRDRHDVRRRYRSLTPPRARRTRRGRSYSPPYYSPPRRRRSFTPPRRRRYTPPRDRRPRVSPERPDSPRRYDSKREPSRIETRAEIHDNQPIYARANKSPKLERKRSAESRQESRDFTIPPKNFYGSREVSRADRSPSPVRRQTTGYSESPARQESRRPRSPGPASRQATRDRSPSPLRPQVSYAEGYQPAGFERGNSKINPLFRDDSQRQTSQRPARQDTRQYSPILERGESQVTNRRQTSQESPGDGWFFDSARDRASGAANSNDIYGRHGDAPYSRHIHSSHSPQRNGRPRTPSPDYSMSSLENTRNGGGGHYRYSSDSLLSDNQFYDRNMDDVYQYNGGMNGHRRYSSQLSDYSSDYGVGHDYEHQWPPPHQSPGANRRGPQGYDMTNNQLPVQRQGTNRVTSNPLFTDGVDLPAYQKKRPGLRQDAFNAGRYDAPEDGVFGPNQRSMPVGPSGTSPSRLPRYNSGPANGAAQEFGDYNAYDDNFNDSRPFDGRQMNGNYGVQQQHGRGRRRSKKKHRDSGGVPGGNYGPPGGNYGPPGGNYGPPGGNYGPPGGNYGPPGGNYGPPGGNYGAPPQQPPQQQRGFGKAAKGVFGGIGKGLMKKAGREAFNAVGDGMMDGMADGLGNAMGEGFGEMAGGLAGGLAEGLGDAGGFGGVMGVAKGAMKMKKAVAAKAPLMAEIRERHRNKKNKYRF